MNNEDKHNLKAIDVSNKIEVHNLPTSREERTIIFLRKGIPIGLIVELIFIFGQDLRLKAMLPTIVDSSLFLMFLFILILSKHTKKYKLLFNCIIAAVLAAVTVSFYSHSASRSVVQSPVIVLIAYLLLSRLGGMIWTAILFINIFTVYLLDKTGILHSKLDYKLTVYCAVTIGILSALLYAYEGINLVNEKIVAKRDLELLELNNLLSQKLEENKNTSTELAKTLETTQATNQLLHDSKLALMNVLDDANSLQTELRTQKENVEKTVMERTAELRFEQARLSASINSIESGLLMTFGDEQDVIYNPALLKIVGIEASDDRLKNIYKKSLIDMLQPKFGDTFNLIESIASTQKYKKPFLVDNLKIGDKFISIDGAPILSDDRGAVVGCVIVIEDKTESMLLERSKDEFISIASHELRTPLTAIQGNADMLVTMFGDKLPNPEVKGMIDDIKDASVRLIGIVNQFLSTSRLEQKKTVFTIKPVDLYKTVQKCIKELSELASKKGIDLKAVVDANSPKVLADEARLREIIINVVGNAIKYTAHGSVEISALQVNGFIEIDVKDSGIGIDPKNQNLLFHKFQQATSDILTRDDSRSTGLGLYVTKLLLEQMGGSIYLKKSVPGEGSIFTFKLPISQERE